MSKSILSRLERLEAHRAANTLTIVTKGGHCVSDASRAYVWLDDNGNPLQDGRHTVDYSALNFEVINE